MKRCEHDYSRRSSYTTPAQIRRGVQKRIIEQVEDKITKLSLEQLSVFENSIDDINV